METIYDWLLHNTGNAGNHYTILNIQREGSDGLNVMARSSDFSVVNLFIYDTQSTDLQEKQPNKVLKNKYIFSSEQQVIDFLAEGKAPDSQKNKAGKGIRVLVTEPDGVAGDITFPPNDSQHDFLMN